MEQARRVKILTTYWIGESSSSPPSEPTKIQSFGPASPRADDHTTINAPARMGLPDGLKPEKRQAGDDSYSGLHDQGPLPPLKEDGPMAVLLACAQEAKKFNDQFLTEIISNQKKQAAKNSHAANTVGKESDNPVKRAKVDGF